MDLIPPFNFKFFLGYSIADSEHAPKTNGSRLNRPISTISNNPRAQTRGYVAMRYRAVRAASFESLGYLASLDSLSNDSDLVQLETDLTGRPTFINIKNLTLPKKPNWNLQSNPRIQKRFPIPHSGSYHSGSS